MHSFIDSAIERNHELYHADRNREISETVEDTTPEKPKLYDWQEVERAEAEVYDQMVWGLISPAHARRIGVPEEEIARQLNQ